jgi:hypothetical protein
MTRGDLFCDGVLTLALVDCVQALIGPWLLRYRSPLFKNFGRIYYTAESFSFEIVVVVT